ncbi:PAS domain-containing sensor histidine kinase [Gaetbulibacter aestuarii]|uniref:histidine kinase n=1 Tax=Gaetbulibacter aestuarii TaxID=1502358 RepID=A0ABW7MXZ3_9FLAO
MEKNEKNNDEKNRVETVLGYDIVDMPPREEFNNLAKLLALSCDVSTTLISFIDAETQYFKGAYGTDLLDKPLISFFLKNLKEHSDELITFNLNKTNRQKLSLIDNDINFFASYPLTNSDGIILGSICLMDAVEKELSSNQIESVKLIAQQIIDFIELRKQTFHQEEKGIWHDSKVEKPDYDNVIELGNLGTWRWDMKTNKAWFNNKWAEMLGYDLSELEPTTFQTWVDLLHPDDLTSAAELLTQLEKKNTYMNQEFRLKTKDGKYKWIRSRGKVIQKDKQGKPLLSFGIIEDIHERKITEIHLNRINENLPAAVFRYVAYEDGRDQFLYYTKKLNKIYDLPEDLSLEGDNINLVWEKIHPDDISIVQQAIQKSKQELSEFRAEWRIICNNGAIKWLRSYGTISHKNQSMTIWDTTLFDITEEKKTSQALELTNRRLVHAQHIAKIGYWKYNLDKSTILWSDEVYNIFELDQATTEVTFELFKSFVHSKDKHLFKDESYLVSTEVSTSEFRILLSGNRIKWLKVTFGFQTFNNDGNRINEGVIQDITKEKRLLNSIEAYNERFKLVTRATSDIIWDWDIVQDQVVFGENFKEILDEDFNNEIISSQTFIERYIHGNDRKRVMTSLSRTLESKDEFWECEFRVKSKHGNYLNIDDKALILRSKKGKPMRMVGAMNDITKIKQQNRKLKQLNKNLNLKSKELLLSNNDLEQFAYVASHDLQEPLRMITGFLTLLDKKYNDKLDEKAKTYIHFAVDGAKRMRLIILDLLDYSRVGRLDRKLTKVNVTNLVEDVVSLNNRKIKESKAIIHIEELPTITSYYSELSQVFNNLINNALKYQKPGNIPEVTISSKDLNSHWEFSVKDNGIGINPKYFEQVFVIFKRLHTKDAFSGTGIGLAITKKIVTSLGGDIKITKSGKQGSIFQFTIKK